MPKRGQAAHCCAAILSGGLSTRMDGRNKAFLQVGGHTILNRLLAALQPCFEEILLVTRQPELYAETPVRVVTDLYEDRSSLTGIHAALVQSRSEFAFVVPCDTPFLQPAIIKMLLDAVAPEWDVVVPLLEGYYEPLCAVYSKRTIPMIAAQLDSGNYRIFDFFDQVNVKTLSAEHIKAADPDRLSFLNVNTTAALRACQTLLQKKDES